MQFCVCDVILWYVFGCPWKFDCSMFARSFLMKRPSFGVCWETKFVEAFGNAHANADVIFLSNE